MSTKVLLLAGVLALTSLSPALAQVKKIGETFDYEAQSPHPYRTSPAPDYPTWEHTIYHPGALYLRAWVTMRLAPGDYLSVLDASRKEIWRYGGNGPLQGQEFLTDTVFGDRITLALHAPFGDGWGLEVRAYDWGWPPQWYAHNSPETHCNSPTGQVDYDCLTDPTLLAIGDACIGLVGGGGIFCSASICSSQGHVITANHCVGSASSASTTNLWLRYEEICGTGTIKPGSPIVVPAPMAYLVGDNDHDFTVMLPPSNPSTIVGHVMLEPRDPAAGEPLYIIGHPSGRAKEYAPGPATGVTSAGCTGSTPNTHMRYRFDTEGGNSGSGVFSSLSNCQVAVHTCGGCTVGDPSSSNSGGRMSQILPMALSVVPNLAVCGAQPPDPVRGRDALVNLFGPAPNFDRNYLNVGPDGDIKITLSSGLAGPINISSPDLLFAPQSVPPGSDVTITVPNNQKPGHYEILAMQPGGSQDMLVVAVGQEPMGVDPSWGAVHRVYPTTHSATGAVSDFNTVGTGGNLVDLGFDEDFGYQTSAWVGLNSTGGGVIRGRPLSDEFDFVIDPSGATLGSQIQSLDILAEAYFTGLQGTGSSPPTGDDSSEEDMWHAAKVQIFDFGSANWIDVGTTFIDTTQYAWGSAWRNVTYAERWCRPTHPSGYAGPIFQFDAAPSFPDSVVDTSGGNSLVRVRVANWMEISSGNWDSTRYYDEVRLTVNTGGGNQSFNPTAFRAVDGTGGGIFKAVGSGGSVADLVSNNGVYAWTYFRDSTTQSPAGSGPPIQLQYASELDFDLTPTGLKSGDDIGQLRLFAELYMRDAVGTAIPVTPSFVPEKSGEDILHACRFEIYDWTAGTWSALTSFLDPSQYTLGTAWTGTYAESWGSGGAAYAGPVDQILTTLSPGHVQPGTNLMRLRLYKDALFGDSISGASVSHVFDQIYLELRPAGVVPRGHGCEASAGSTPVARILSSARISENLVISQYLGQPALGTFPVIGFSDTMLAGVPLPIDLTPFGATNCVVYSSHNLVLGAILTGANGEAALTIPASNDPVIVGFPMYLQWYQFDLTANTLGLIASDMITLTLGT